MGTRTVEDATAEFIARFSKDQIEESGIKIAIQRMDMSHAKTIRYLYMLGEKPTKEDLVRMLNELNQSMHIYYATCKLFNEIAFELIAKNLQLRKT